MFLGFLTPQVTAQNRRHVQGCGQMTRQMTTMMTGNWGGTSGPGTPPSNEEIYAMLKELDNKEELDYKI
nr:MAG: ORF4 [Torque teno polar bear virus 45]